MVFATKTYKGRVSVRLLMFIEWRQAKAIKQNESDCNCSELGDVGFEYIHRRFKAWGKLGVELKYIKSPHSGAHPTLLL